MDEKKLTYRDVFLLGEQQSCAYNFEHSNPVMLQRHFDDAKETCAHLISLNLAIPAYEQCIKANHLFNMLSARGVVSVTQRADFIGQIRRLAKACCEVWMSNQENNPTFYEPL